MVVTEIKNHPQREHGSDLSSCREPGNYGLYVRWLSDYLHTAEIPLSADQAAWLQGRSPDSVIFACSDVFGYTVDVLEGLNTEFDSGESHVSHLASIQAHWDDFDAEPLGLSSDITVDPEMLREYI